LAITTIPGAGSSDATTLVGTTLADTLAIASDNLDIDLLEGADTVTSAGASTKLILDSGADGDQVTFSGALTSSTINLNTGDDISSFQSIETSTFLGDRGNDRFTFNRDGDTSTVKGGAGNDTVTFAQKTSDISIFGNSDDDQITITGAGVNTFVFAGKQDDTITVSASLVGGKIRGDKGNDRLNIDATLSGTVVAGGEGDDNIDISSTSVTASTIFGGKGVDDIDGEAGAAALFIRGDKGNDSINTASDQKHTLLGGEGNDSIDHDGGNGTSDKAVSIDGGAGNDQIRITVANNDAANVLNGNDGNDTIIDTNGASTIDGGAGNDNITTGQGKDIVFAKAGNDQVTINGTANKNVLGGTGNDKFVITTPALLTSGQTLKGQTGDDEIEFTADLNVVGDIVDSVFQNVSTVKTVSYDGDVQQAATDGTPSITLAAKAQAGGINVIDYSGLTDAGTNNTGVVATASFTAYTSSVNTSLIGSNDAAVVGGVGGDAVKSVLVGGAGNDTLDTGTGGETSAGGAGGNADGDVLTGGAGNDLFIIRAEDGIAAGNGTITTILDLAGNDNFQLTSDADHLEASVSADFTASSTTFNNKALASAFISVNNGIDASFANATGSFGVRLQATTLAGVANATASTLIGSAQADSILGGSGADVITGSNGQDTLSGGVGQDTLTGGTGTDEYTIPQVNSETGTGISQITNFTGGTDILNLTTNAVGTINTASTNADLFINSADVASTGTTTTTLLANLSTASGALAANAFDHTGDTFVVTITGASLLGTGISYVVQNDAANTTVTAADTIIALSGTSNKALTVATVI
jgi:Ca2+-binding RTX toxin-like protein